MEYKKNSQVEIEITDTGVSGEGIGKIDGFTLFVKIMNFAPVIYFASLDFFKQFHNFFFWNSLTASIYARCVKMQFFNLN